MVPSLDRQLPSCDDYTPDLAEITRLFYNLRDTLPWPVYIKPENYLVHVVAPLNLDGKLYYLFDARSTIHPFSNRLYAPVPISRLVGDTVSHFKMALMACK